MKCQILFPGKNKKRGSSVVSTLELKVPGLILGLDKGIFGV